MRRFVLYEPWHWMAVVPRERDVVDSRLVGPLFEHKWSRTFMMGETPVAIVGVVIPYAGLGYVWARFSERARGHGLSISRGLVGLIEEARSSLRLRQLRAEVVMDNLEYRRWIELLGFGPESIKQGAAPDGGDLVEYVLCLQARGVAAGPVLLRGTMSRTGARSGATTSDGRTTSGATTQAA